MSRTWKEQLKRCVAVVLTMAMLLQYVVWGPLPVRAVTEASAAGKLTLGEALLDYQQTLRDEGNGKFTLTIVLKNGSSIQDNNTDPTVSRNNFFTAPADGEYLIQLWGGAGADGTKPDRGEAGKGGAGGYVYGVVKMTKGQTLFYQLGGKGQQTTSQDSGGGVNGNGGNAGSYANNTIGGGGGYSAVYLFEIGEFENKYLNADGEMITDNISEDDRVSKYIMIAGGGGGGGAGSGGGISILRDEGYAPNGGIGGTMGISASAKLPNGGTYFAGANGNTSGTSTAYVGVGGTDRPGDINQTWLTDQLNTHWFEGLQPNDWFRSYDANSPGGNGGAGNLRGGGGGAGYTGGSGGMQSSLILPTNVGGGGGGASYVGSGVKIPATAPSGTNPGNGNGGIILTPLSVTEDSLTKINLSYAASEYFDVSISKGTVSNISLADGKAKTIVFLFAPKAGFAGGNGVPLLADDLITLTDASQNNATAQMTLSADCSAVNVPLNLTVETRIYNPAVAGTKYVAAFADGTESNWLHKPLQGNDFLNVGSYEVVYKDHTDTVQLVDYQPEDAGTHLYTFTYTVTPTKKPAAVGTPVPTQQKISGTARVKINIVGSDGAQIEDGSITVTKALSYDSINGHYVLSIKIDGEATKTVDPVGGQSVSQTWNYAGEGDYYTVTSEPIEASGYYYLQAWGGDGGNGGKRSSGDNKPGIGGYGAYLEGVVYLPAGAKVTVTMGRAGENAGQVNGSSSSDGGEGGKYTKVEVTYPKEYAQEHDHATTVTILIAGGGGGGGGVHRKNIFSSYNGLGRTENVAKMTTAFSGMNLNGYNMDVPKYTGTDVDANYQNSNLIVNLQGTQLLDETGAWNGSDGSDGSDESSGKRFGNNPKAGDAGFSYKSGLLMDDASGVSSTLYAGYHFTDGRTSSLATTTEKYNDINAFKLTDESKENGKVRLNSLVLEQTPGDPTDAQEALRSLFSGYEVAATIARYFTVKSVTGGETPENANPTFAYNVNQETGETLVTASNLALKVIVDTSEPDASTKEIKVSASAEYTVTITMVRTVGFLGGNDVPLLREATVKPPGQDAITLTHRDETDYANVPLQLSLSSNDIIATDDKARTIDHEEGRISVATPSGMYSLSDRLDFKKLKDWQHEFVELDQVLTEKGSTQNILGQTLAPTTMTKYTVTVTLHAKAEPVRASVGDAAGSSSASEDISIIVVPRIHYQLTNVETSYQERLYQLESKQYLTVKNPELSFEDTLSVQNGYAIPQTIRVLAYDGTDITASVSYNPISGKFIIPSEYLVGTITVIAEAKLQTYTITFYKQQAPNSTVFDKITGEFEFAPGADLTSVIFPGTPGDVPAGYTFQWSWGDWDPSNGTTEDGVPNTMPGKNMIVYGTYVPNEHTITVEYVDAGGKTLLTNATIRTHYGAKETVYAPAIEGYIPTQTVIVIDKITGDVTIQFVYNKAAGNLVVIYQYPDGSQAHKKTELSIELRDEGYTVTFPQITGYAPHIQADGEWTLTEQYYLVPTQDDVNNGVVVYVLYVPKRYDVNFESNGGNDISTFYEVEYGNVFNYNAFTERMEGLPVPVRAGYTFLGWYLGDTLIEGHNVVKITEDITLTARWKQNVGTVTIRFLDETDNELDTAHVITSEEMTSGVFTDFDKSIETDDGLIYTTLTTEVAYTFTAQNQVFVVRYYLPKTVTVQYVDPEGNLLIQVEQKSVTVGGEYELSYKMTTGGDITVTHVAGVTIDGDGNIVKSSKLYKPTTGTVEGTLEERDLVVRVICTQVGVATVVSVTVSWGTLEYIYDYGDWNAETHSYDISVRPKDYPKNTVTVTSGDESTVPVHVAVKYQAKNGYEAITGYFTYNSTQDEKDKTDGFWLGLQESNKVFLWLDCDVPMDMTGTTVTGQCTVTITAGNTTQENGT